MNIVMTVIASLIVLSIIFLDRWMWDGGKVGCVLGWSALIVLGVVPVMFEPAMAVLALPFLLIQLKHSWKCNVSETC